MGYLRKGYPGLGTAWGGGNFPALGRGWNEMNLDPPKPFHNPMDLNGKTGPGILGIPAVASSSREIKNKGKTK